MLCKNLKLNPNALHSCPCCKLLHAFPHAPPSNICVGGVVKSEVEDGDLKNKEKTIVIMEQPLAVRAFAKYSMLVL